MLVLTRLVSCSSGTLVAVAVAAACIVAAEGGLKERPASDWQQKPPSDVGGDEGWQLGGTRASEDGVVDDGGDDAGASFC